MNINIPDFAIKHFWEEPPEDSWEFWAFSFKPKCKIGDDLIFRYNGNPIAKAICEKIEPPGASECESTGRFKDRWKVYWHPDTFVDLKKKGGGR